MVAEALHESVFCRRRTQTVEVRCSMLLYSCSVCCSVLYYVLCKAAEIPSHVLWQCVAMCVLSCVSQYVAVCVAEALRASAFSRKKTQTVAEYWTMK